MRGQVCYQADLNQYKVEDGWEEAVQTGLSFIVDTNEEYDLNNLLAREADSIEAETSKESFISAYKEPVRNKEASLRILLETISKIITGEGEA